MSQLPRVESVIYDVDIVVGKTGEPMEDVKVFLHKIEDKAVTAK